MRVEAFLADSVQASEGKLYALGIGWTTISTQRFPARHDRIGIGIVVHLDGEGGPQHRLEIRFLGPGGDAHALGSGPDGRPMDSLGIPFAGGGGGPSTATFALNLNGLPFEREGDYAFTVSIDDAEAARLPFRVQAPPATPSAEYRAGVYL